MQGPARPLHGAPCRPEPALPPRSASSGIKSHPLLISGAACLHFPPLALRGLSPSRQGDEGLSNPRNSPPRTLSHTVCVFDQTLITLMKYWLQGSRNF